MFALRTNWNRPLGDSCDNGLETKRSIHSLTGAGHGLTLVAQTHLWCTPMPEVPWLPFAGQPQTQASWLRRMPTSNVTSSLLPARGHAIQGGRHGAPWLNREVRLRCRSLLTWSQRWVRLSSLVTIGVPRSISLWQRAFIGRPGSNENPTWTMRVRLFAASHGGWAPPQPSSTCHWSCVTHSSRLCSQA